jgi:hypothetical protein
MNSWFTLGYICHKDQMFLRPSVLGPKHAGRIVTRTKGWGTCSGPWKPGLWCHLSKAHNSFGETPGGWKIGVGREWGGGGQLTSNLGPRWTGSHHAKGGIPSKQKGMEGELTGKLARGVRKGNCAITLYCQWSKKGELRHNLILSIYVRVYNNCVNATNQRMCLGYK